MIHSGVEFRPGRGSRQAGQKLEDFALFPRSGRSHLTLFQHPGRWGEGHDRVMGQVTNRSPADLRPAADHAAGGANHDGLHDIGRLWSDCLGGTLPADRFALPGRAAGNLDGRNAIL